MAYNNSDQIDYAIREETNPNLVKRNPNVTTNSTNETALNESMPDVENKTSKKPKSNFIMH